jgi:hypothetical protein
MIRKKGIKQLNKNGIYAREVFMTFLFFPPTDEMRQNSDPEEKRPASRLAGRR